jgi:hypothetical protein
MTMSRNQYCLIYGHSLFEGRLGTIEFSPLAYNSKCELGYVVPGNKQPPPPHSVLSSVLIDTTGTLDHRQVAQTVGFQG